MRSAPKILDEFIDHIPKHINDMPCTGGSGVTRSEQEWKYMAFAMSKEIDLLRKLIVGNNLTINNIDYDWMLFAASRKLSDRIDVVVNNKE